MSAPKDVLSAVIPPPGAMPSDLTVMGAGKLALAVLPSFLTEVDKALGGDSLLSFGAEALAQGVELVAVYVRALASGKGQAEARRELDDALTDIVENLKLA